MISLNSFFFVTLIHLLVSSSESHPHSGDNNTSQWSSHRPHLYPNCLTVRLSAHLLTEPPVARCRDPLTPVSDPPEDISLPDFIYNEQYRVQKSDKVNSFTCGLTGKSIKASEAQARVEAIAKALSKRIGWVSQQEETEWEKIACIYSINAVSFGGS